MADYSGAIQWLLGSSDPSIRYLALTEVLGKSPSDQEASQCRDLITGSSRIRNLLSGQNEDGGFGKDPYRKWDGAHWRLVSLVNLAIPPNNSQALKVAEKPCNFPVVREINTLGSWSGWQPWHGHNVAKHWHCKSCA